MKLRRYLGKDAAEAIKKVKHDLGSEAVIISTRKVKQKGVFGFFQKPLIEVVAAIDEFTAKPAVENRNIKDVRKIDKDADKENEKHKEDEKIVNLENKVSGMEEALYKLLSEVKNISKNNNSVMAETNPSSIFELFYKNLVKNDVDSEIARKVIEDIKKKSKLNPSVNETAAIMLSTMVEMIGKPQVIKLREDNKPTVIIFVGPTGVGKTTTLAKIAANYSLNLNKKVGLITADTYRIAAVEQLKTYAEILGIPVSVVYSAMDIKKEINNFSDKDIVLIDTAGRSSRNKSQFNEIKVLVDATEADEVYLVLSSTTSSKTCKDIIKSYEFLKTYKLIFTKLDETPVTGILFNATQFTQKNLSYITTGQNVPDDIEIADTDKIIKNLLGSMKND